MFWTKTQKNSFWNQGIDTTNIFALMGSINVGKETLLDGLLKNGTREDTYPETSIKVQGGQIPGSDHIILNIPGEFTFSAESEEEILTKRIFLENRANKIIFVADAKNLKNSLAQFLYFREFGVPMIFNINMMDQAQLQGIDINIEKLAECIGTKVNTSVAIERMGVSNLKKLLDGDIPTPKGVTYPAEIEKFFKTFEELLPTPTPQARQLALSLLVGDKFSQKHFKKSFDESVREPIEALVASTKKQFNKRVTSSLYDIYLDRAQEIFEQVATVSPTTRLPFEKKFGIWSRNLATGLPIAAVVIALMFIIVGKVGAEFLVDLLEGQFFGEIIIPYVESYLVSLDSNFLKEMIVGQFGLLTVGIALPIGLVAPVLLSFYFYFNILESSGYLPRLAILFDRLYKKIGMSGKGIIPMIMGFSCITMAILTTRMLDTKRERNMATFLILLGIPCAPLLGMMLVLLSTMPVSAYFFLFGLLATQIFVIGFIVNKLFKYEHSSFIFNIPPLQVPNLKSAVIGAFRQTYAFLKEAIPIFAGATFAVFILDQLGVILMIENLFRPLISGYIGLPNESTSIFIMSVIRREAGIALLKQFADGGVFTNVQIIINLLLVAFMIPCINAILVIFKERGWKIACSITSFTITYAIIIGTTLNFGFKYFGITFTLN